MSGGWNIIQATTPYMKMYSIKLINTIWSRLHIIHEMCDRIQSESFFSCKMYKEQENITQRNIRNITVK